MVLFTGCFSLGVRGEYKSYQNEFYKMVSKPFTEKERKYLEKRFEDLKDKIQKGEYSKKEKEKYEKDINYYLMVLEDLKD
jgi:hypothetical protein